MSVSYIPVLAAKRGEFTALSKLQPSAAQKLIPLFELPSKKPGTKTFEPSINRTAMNAGKAWTDRHAFLDISKWSPNARTESGIHILEYALSQFRSYSVIAHPVIGYDRWDDPQYVQALANIRASNPITPCIRLDREAIENDMLDMAYFTERIDHILDTMDLVPENCFVMIDFGDVSTIAIPDIISHADAAVSLLRSIGFNIVILAGGSMPAGVNEAINSTDAEGCIPRFEMMAWKAVFASQTDQGIVFGDYIIRNPSAAEGVIAPHANAKIRYTLQNQYFIVRGHSKQFHSLEIQHKALAQKLVASPHFMGGSFSWADAELVNCSLGLKPLRDATGMIAIDSNHHINVVLAEVFEQHSYIAGTRAVMPKQTT